LNILSAAGRLTAMDESYSSAAARALSRADEWAAAAGLAEATPGHLFRALVDEPESRGATLLLQHGLDMLRLPAIVPPSPGASAPATPLQTVLRAAERFARGAGPVGTEHLLRSLVESAPETRPLLIESGCDLGALEAALQSSVETAAAPLTAAIDWRGSPVAADQIDVYRILDVAANRAREGLRVLEDYVRFARDDPTLSTALKHLRHELKKALDLLPVGWLLASRDTERDVGTTIHSPSEDLRQEPRDVWLANFKRVQEALRSLEEYGKLECVAVARQLAPIRYRLYTLERAVQIGQESVQRLDRVVLYVLVTTSNCPGGIDWTVREALAGGAQVIQLREKDMPDRELLTLARRLRPLVHDAGALFIMNDRPDLARLCEADGVHVGQEELAVKDARRIVGPHALIGVSTHSLEQARQAVFDGANYIGVGPTFTSETKPFDAFPGIDFVRAVHAEVRLPAFVVGGVTLDRLPEVITAGGRRVALSHGICASEDPRGCAAEFRRQLDAAELLTQ
jgi:thiamine-phosphate pyrophosphorylase